MATPFLANLALTAPLADYDQTVRTVQQALSDMLASFLSDPGNAARAILAAVDAPAAPLRLAFWCRGRGYDAGGPVSAQPLRAAAVLIAVVRTLVTEQGVDALYNGPGEEWLHHLN